MSSEETSHLATQLSKRFWPTLIVFAGVAVFFLWDEHEAHIRGLLPYVLVLACPLMHVFMHGKHGHHRHGSPQTDKSSPGEKKQ